MQCEGLEVIGRNQTTAKAQGGASACDAGVKRRGAAAGRIAVCVREARTRRWIYGLRDIDKAVETLPRKTRVLCVMDRAADVFALFASQRTLQRAHVLVRAQYNRPLGVLIRRGCSKCCARGRRRA